VPNVLSPIRTWRIKGQFIGKLHPFEELKRLFICFLPVVQVKILRQDRIVTGKS
jgi:hypothetical protein